MQFSIKGTLCSILTYKKLPFLKLDGYDSLSCVFFFCMEIYIVSHYYVII